MAEIPEDPYRSSDQALADEDDRDAEERSIEIYDRSRDD